ncbi:MAG: cryptochrome/photolyase family protein [Gammaproteobacteria bacterium]
MNTRATNEGTQGAVILWLRSDLRLTDNRALNAAANTGKSVIPVFILDDSTAGEWSPGGASRWWLHHSLVSLSAGIRALGGRLILRRGDSRAELARLIEEAQADELCFTRCYEPNAVELEKSVADALSSRVAVRRFGGHLLFEPEQLRTKAGAPFRVFSPFWKACLREPDPGAPKTTSRPIDFSDHALASDSLDDWSLLPESPDWAGGLRDNWQPGEAGAHSALQVFTEQAVGAYQEQRDRPDLQGTSRLSAHLHFGEISPRQVWHAVNSELHFDSSLSRGGESWLREIGWREFSYHLLTHWPDLPEQPFRKEFSTFPWRSDPEALGCWQRGMTGYPLVDAGMRELWVTGWMHNRVRMIAASFLVKHLLIPWQEGEAWFWDTLVDADLANNSAGWQWVAGSGADAAPFFRIFNPIVQGKKFDPDGDYVRRWVPELAGVPTKYLHEPWSAPPELLADAGVAIGKDYPAPIVEHAAARERALEAFKSLRR